MLKQAKHYFHSWKNGLDAENKRIAEYLSRKHKGKYFPLLHPDMIRWITGNIAYTCGFIWGIFCPVQKTKLK
jgi:hypothetical protein